MNMGKSYSHQMWAAEIHRDSDLAETVKSLDSNLDLLTKYHCKMNSFKDTSHTK